MGFPLKGKIHVLKALMLSKIKWLLEREDQGCDRERTRGGKVDLKKFRIEGFCKVNCICCTA